MNTKNIKLVMQYAGTNYYGFQRQPQLPTVQGKVEEVLGSLMQQKVSLTPAGRTDAGVHAYHQVANFRTEQDFPLERLQVAANTYLPSDITIADVTQAPNDFDARRQARWREYHYYILNRPFPSPFWNSFSWLVPRPIDVLEVEKSFKVLLGRHDFSAFTLGCRADQDNKVNILDIGIGKSDGLCSIRVRAEAFITHMVRILVGTLSEVGTGQRSASDIRDILASRDRRQAGRTAPAKGLILTNVSYAAGGSSEPARLPRWLSFQ